MFLCKHRGPEPRRPAILVYLGFLVYFAVLLFLARLAFFLYSYLHAELQNPVHVLKALYIGFRFDLRWAAILTLPVGLVLSIPPLRRRVAAHKKIAAGFYSAVLALVWLVYFVDAAFFLYLGERLNATIIDLAVDMKDGLTMVWQSYPVPLLLLAFAALLLVSAWPLWRMLRVRIKECRSKKSAALVWLGAFLIFAVSAYGQLSTNYFPLRWSQAYFSPNYAITALGLNPMQNLYDTYLASKDDGFDLEATRASYPLMAAYLGVDEPDAQKLNFARHYAGHDVAGLQPGEKPNIVIIIMESFSWPQSSFGPGGVSEHSPYMKELAKESVLFPSFFSNARTTARGVFSIMTGIPDVTETSTGSRNQRVIDQRLIADQFKGYDKYYLLGGNTNWANIRGIIGNNIEGLTILEEGYWKAPNIDVWGIHDYDLLMESHDLLTTLSERPFLAVIQTASFHKPYTIPKNVPFERVPLSPEAAAAYDFREEDEYNAFRFADYAIHLFFEKAKKSNYYNKTIFFLVGDHGNNRTNTYSSDAYKASKLFGWHVVAMVHAPWLIKPGVYEDPASQVDIFPTLASLAGIEHTNWTLGRDLFDKKALEGNYAFISGQSSVPIRLAGGGSCFVDNRTGQQALYDLSNGAVDLAKEEPERFKAMRDLAAAYQASAKYLLYNNKKTTTLKRKTAAAP